MDLNELSIAELRQQAKALRIETEKDWDKSMFVAAIDARRKSRAICRIITDESAPIPPGFSRIMIPKGAMGSSSPVSIQLNRFKTTLPRDVVVDVPTELLEILNNSHEVGTEEIQTPDGRYVTKLVNQKSYPYMHYGTTKGKSGLIKGGNAPATQSLREKFREIFGRWPRNAQFKAFRDDWMAKMAGSSFKPEEIEAAFKAAGAKDAAT